MPWASKKSIRAHQCALLLRIWPAPTGMDRAYPAQCMKPITASPSSTDCIVRNHRDRTNYCEVCISNRPYPRLTSRLSMRRHSKRSHNSVARSLGFGRFGCQFHQQGVVHVFSTNYCSENALPNPSYRYIQFATATCRPGSPTSNMFLATGAGRQRNMDVARKIRWVVATSELLISHRMLVVLINISPYISRGRHWVSLHVRKNVGSLARS